jgi:preprotein translocase subunit SecA
VLTGLLDGSRRQHRQHRAAIEEIERYWHDLEPLSERDLDARIAALRTGDGTRHERIAVAAETIRRTLGLRLHANQLAGALALGSRQVVELATGEGKTVMVVPFAFDAVCDGRSVHVATANTYLAGRDADWMAPAYRRLQVSVSSVADVVARDQATREALQADVCYGTVATLASLWLSDQLVLDTDERLWRQGDVCLVDEADAVLLDLVRSPIALTRTVDADRDQTQHYRELADLLVQADDNGDNGDWGVDEARGVAALLDTGVDKLEAALGVQLYDGHHSHIVAGVTDALIASALLHPGRDYLVEDGRIRPINPITGRVGNGRFRSGLMSALEAKEQLEITDDVEILAQVGAGAFLARYPHLCGMTATAVSARDEFVELYGLDTFALEPHLGCVRTDHEDVIAVTAEAKFGQIAAETAERHRRGQPVLIGVETTGDLHQVTARLDAASVTWRALSAENHAQEATILADAGRYGAVTVATRMAGRGVDIVLGGADATAQERQAVIDAGGLCVIGAQRFDNRRGDDQLRGRAGRQGDPGESRFYVSLEDELVRVYARDALAAVIDRLNRLQGETLGHRQMTRLLDKAQAAKSEQQHALRKTLLAYDAVLTVQRDRFYRLRERILHAHTHAELERTLQHLATNAEPGGPDPSTGPDQLADPPVPDAADPDSGHADLPPRRRSVLRTLDAAWRRHLEDCQQLRTGIGLRSIGQRNPLVEYQRESAQILRGHLAAAYGELTGHTHEPAAHEPPNH